MGQLAQKVRAKFPGAYDDLDDATLEQQVLAKHPEYADLAHPTAPDMTRPVLGHPLGATDTPSTLDTVNDSLQGLAHPQSAGDMAGLLIPAGIETAITAAKGYTSAATDAIAGGATLRKLPGGMLRTLYQKAFPTADQAEAARRAVTAARTEPEITRGADMYSMPRADRVVDRAPKAAQVFGGAEGDAAAVGGPSSAPSAGLTADQRAQLAKQGYTPETIAKVEAQMAADGPPPVGRLRTAPPVQTPPHPPVQVDTSSLPESWKPLAEGPARPDLQQPRVDIGAERVGRGQGLTKEQVRQQTAPILGEAQGEASPILPEKALGRIIDTLKAMPKDGPEREAYVQAATSGKTQWQIENIRRTLEHLGLVAPLVAAPSLRDRVLARFGTRDAQN